MAFRTGREPTVCQTARYEHGIGIRGCTLNNGHKPPCRFEPITCNNSIFCPAEFHDPWCERYIADQMQPPCEDPDCDDCVTRTHDHVAEPCDFPDEEQPPMTEEYEVLVNPEKIGTGIHEILEEMNRQSFSRAIPPLPMGGNMGRAHVNHYAQGEIETIDFIRDKLGLDGVTDYILGNILKYASRAKHKGQLDDDVEKIRNYAVILQEMRRRTP